jgi:ABC-type methionine transport system permease subunit
MMHLLASLEGSGFGLAALTGVTFFVGAPDQSVNNVAFYAKLTFLIYWGRMLPFVGNAF